MVSKCIHFARTVTLALSFVGVVGNAAYACQERPCSRAEWLRYDEPILSQSAPAPDTSNTSNGLLVAGLGAIAGVVIFNLTVGGTAALPFFAASAGAGTGAGAGALSASEGAVAVSRVYAVTSAVAGALVADWFFHAPQEQRIRTVPSRLAARLDM